jgi:hypothetical protein
MNIRTQFPVWAAVAALTILSSGKLHAQGPTESTQDTTATAPSLFAPVADASPQEQPLIGHGSRGFFIRSPDNVWLLQLQFRLQFRAFGPWDFIPDGRDDFQNPSGLSLGIRRSRIKVSGHGFRPWLAYAMEYDVGNSVLLNYTLDVNRWDQFRIKVGQWKAVYSRERVVSSGRQQQADRSIVNRIFTIDRQQGVSFYGRLAEGTAADIMYDFSVLTGTGRGNPVNDDDNLMYMGRLQWNPLGRDVPMRGGDLGRSENPALSIALGGVTNQSPCTRFSTSGCGRLNGFEVGEEGQFRVNQAIVETAFIWKGFSWAQEFHWKSIEDTFTDVVTDLDGNYVQAGYFFSEAFDWFPEPLELGARWAFSNTDGDNPDSRVDEYTFAVNWFFSGHDNKLTAEYAHFNFSDDVPEDVAGGRFRLQWDIQF